MLLLFSSNTLPHSLQHPTCERSLIFNSLNIYVGGRASGLPISIPPFHYDELKLE